MKNKWFDCEIETSKQERFWRGTVRIFGVDFSVAAAGWLSDWVIFDCKLPANYGVFLQVLFLIISIGRLPDDKIPQNQGD